MKFKKTSGGSIEIFCLSPHSQYHDVTAAMLQKEKVWWNCLIGGASKWKPGMQLEKIISAPAGDIVLKAAIVERNPENFMGVMWQPGDLSLEILCGRNSPATVYETRGGERR